MVKFYQMKLKTKKKVALVLSGGGAKAAAFHIGVCLALQEKGFKFAGGSKEEVAKNFPDNDPMTIRTYVGSSAGSLISAVLANGFPLESLMNAFEVGAGKKSSISKSDHDYLTPLTYKYVFDVSGKNWLGVLPGFLKRRNLVTGGIEAFIKSGFKLNGLFTTRGLQRYIEDSFPYNRFDQLGVELFIIGTQLNHTRKAIFGDFAESSKTDKTKFVNYATISQAVAASTALPPVFSPYGIERPDGKTIYYFDGEIRDTLSTHVAADHGADLVISSYSVHPYKFTEEIGSLHNFGIPAIINQALYQVIQQKIDKHIDQQVKYKQIYKAIEGYFKQAGIANEHRDKILEIISSRVGYKPNVDYIHIHPPADNYEMFFADHFSLNPEVLSQIVRFGFKSGIHALRNIDL